MPGTNIFRLVLCAGLLVAIFGSFPAAQKKRSVKTQKPAPPPASEAGKLKDEYLKITKEYKASLQKLLQLYEKSQVGAEQRLTQSQALYKDGLLSRKQVEDSEHAVAIEKGRVSGVQQQIATADTQIAEALVEVEGDKEISKMGPLRKGTVIQGASFIRYTGAGGWSLSNAGKIQNFFFKTFNRALPIAVFGQGAIHDRWRLDHHNAMDISVKPDDPDGQALMAFLRSNGIPFSAFRVAIPGVATGPHIHIGLPSHRY